MTLQEELLKDGFVIIQPDPIEMSSQEIIVALKSANDYQVIAALIDRHSNTMILNLNNYHKHQEIRQVLENTLTALKNTVHGWFD